MAKKNAIVQVSLNDDLSAITFNVEGQKSPIVIDMMNLNADVTRRATVHGIVQKVSDAAALGKDATPADKFNAMKAVADRIVGPEGEWNKRAEGSGEGNVPGIIRRAFVEFATSNGKTEKAANDYYDGLDRKGQLALRKVAEIATIIDRIKSERGPKSAVDGDKLLAELK
jgi:hypothetical protein